MREASFGLPLSGSPRTSSPAEVPYFFAWSPDGKNSCLLDQRVRHDNATHLVSGARPISCNARASLGLLAVSRKPAATAGISHLSYSPDGRFITWAQNITDVFRMWTARGVDVTPKTPFVQKTIWSARASTFKDTKGIEVLRNGRHLYFPAGVAWIRPKASQAEARSCTRPGTLQV